MIETKTATPTRDGAAMNGSHGGRHDAGHVRVAIVGTGFVGLSMAHALRQAGIEDWVALERSDQVGGVWRDNTYPGIACDVPSHLYSLSFAPNPDWQRTYSSGRQIWEYAQRVARELRIAEQTRFGEELLDARWDDERSVWRLRTTTLELTAEVVVDGTGPIAEPKLPTIRGLDRFEGTAVSLRALEPSAAADRQAGRGDRNGLLGDPDRPRDPAAGRAHDRLSAHRGLGAAAV